jgi:hypothetical protein
MSERKKKLILAGLSLVLTLGFAEAALRITGIGAAGRGSQWFAGGNHPRFLFQPDPASGYTLRADFHGTEISPAGEFQVTATVDRLGLRDHRHTAPPHPCLLALGDSMTFGEGVEVDESWSALLERDTGIRVYNGGVPGYGSPQMAARLGRLLPVLHPDGVVLALMPYWDGWRAVSPFLYRDGYIVSPNYAHRLYLIGGNLYSTETKLPVLGPLTAWAKGHSNLMRLALPPLFGLARKLVGQGGDARAAGAAGAADPEPTIRAVAEAKRRAEQSGAGFLLVLLDSDTRGHEYRDARLALEKALREHGLPFVSLDELLPDADWPALSYPEDAHWKTGGHRIVAMALAPRVRELAAAHSLRR